MAESRSRFSWRVPTLGILLLLLLVGMLWHQPISDRIRLIGYTPNPAVAQLAAADGFNAKSTHLFYINRPEIVAKQSFATRCSSQSEQTIVLGCYHGVQNGIYVLRIAGDSRLEGVMEVTAAHEMLHAGYDRLTKAQRSQVDGWLEDYYQHDLKDERIKKTIAAYQKSEPDAVVNEMHSVFGTEASDLPAPLEQYYKQYFTDRHIIVAMADQYQVEFTSRVQQVADYDTRLGVLKTRITANETTLAAKSASLKAEAAEMQQLKASGDARGYNSRVGSYNLAVEAFNKLVTETKGMINDYNQLVAARNSVALEQRQLTKELSGESLSTID